MPYDPSQTYYGSGSKSTDWANYVYQRDHQGSMGGNTGSDIFRSIVGGPVGMGEAASGSGATNIFGMNDPLNSMRSSLDTSMTEDVYNSMDEDEWGKFISMDGAGRKAWIAKRTQEINTIGGKYKSDMKAKADAEAKMKAEQAARDTAQNDIIKKVQAFADEMNMPVSKLMQVDDFAKALNAQTYQNSMGAGQGAGPGGLSQVNADLNTKSALLGYQQQRQQAGQQAYDQAFGMISNQNNRSDQLNQYNQGLDLQLQQAEAARRAAVYQQGLSQRQNTFGMIGGIAGMAFGGPTGAAAGQSIGSSIGGSTYGSYNPYKYSYPSTAPSGGGGGLGGTKYGGNS